MSTTATTAAVEGKSLDTTSSLSEKQRRILQYLRQNADSQMYFKSRLIAEDLDLTAKEVGANMRPLLDGEFDVDIEKWGYSSGTTWKVTV
ncbi:hypothetical protein [Haloferax sp. YSMS24]|uniref:DUF7123 family protein n=1 Tax=unclassified Haloferax TaxID=2625095 RepID=UPI00398CA753